MHIECTAEQEALQDELRGPPRQGVDRLFLRIEHTFVGDWQSARRNASRGTAGRERPRAFGPGQAGGGGVAAAVGETAR